MEVKRSKKTHIVVEEEPKRKASKIPPKEPDPRDEFYKKIYAPMNLSGKDLIGNLRFKLERKFNEESLKKVDEALEEAQRRNKSYDEFNNEWLKERMREPSIIKIPSYDEIELFKKVPGAPVPKGLNIESLKKTMVLMNTVTGRISSSSLRVKDGERQAKAEAQLQNARNTPEKYWSTSDGRRVLITEMEDRHLTNTINYLLKKLNKELAFYVSDKYRQLFYRYNTTERGTMTADSFFKELIMLEDLEGSRIAFKRFPKLKNLMSESMKRGLYWEN